MLLLLLLLLFLLLLLLLLLLLFLLYYYIISISIITKYIYIFFYLFSCYPPYIRWVTLWSGSPQCSQVPQAMRKFSPPLKNIAIPTKYDMFCACFVFIIFFDKGDRRTRSKDMEWLYTRLVLPHILGCPRMLGTIQGSPIFATTQGCPIYGTTQRCPRILGTTQGCPRILRTQMS